MLTKAMGLVSLIALTSPCLAQSTCANTSAVKPDIEGHYVDNFGGTQDILDHFWVSGQYIFHICTVDNTKHNIVALNDGANQTAPGKFSRFDWTRYGNRLWYCQTVYEANSEAEAAAAAPADGTDPRIGGCGGKFEWSSLSKLAP